MSINPRMRRLCGVSIILTLALASCVGVHRGRPSAAVSPPVDLSAAFPASADRLYAQLWMETSPEYRASCLQTFNSALNEIRSTVRDAPRVAGQLVGSRGKPLAVVTDLDETILDTSDYQAQLVLKGVEFTQESWARWVSQGAGPKTVPGALEFLQTVEELGLTIVYISNRPESLRSATVRALENLGIEIGGLDAAQSTRMLLRLNDSEKESRRQKVLESYDVIAFIGDNIADFPGFSDHAGAREKIAGQRQLWGRSWFILPNPVYGSWTVPLREKGPRQMLQDLHPLVN